MMIANPNTGEMVAVMQTPVSVLNDHAAMYAQSRDWPQMAIADRVVRLKAFQQLLRDNSDTIAHHISMDIGKPLWESRNEVAISIAKVDATLQAMQYRLHYPQQRGQHTFIQTVCRPLGVVGVIGPFNFPVHIPNGQIIPALLCGNYVIVKASEYAIQSTQCIAALWEQAFLGMPCPITFVYGDASIGKALVANPHVSAIFFTGSTVVGQQIQKACQQHNTLCVAEMGGNNPIIVEDAMDGMIDTIIASAFITSGQRCSCARRLIVNSAHADCIPTLIRRIQGLNIATYPAPNDPFMGPVVLPSIKTRILDGVFDGYETLLASQYTGQGHLISPRVEMGNGHFDEELFGPILFVTRTDSFDESLAEANRSQFGLSCSIITPDASKYHHALNQLSFGVINWNVPTTGASGLAPFGGRKSSGNFRPAGFNMIDHCVVPVATTQQSQIRPLSYPGLPSE